MNVRKLWILFCSLPLLALAVFVTLQRPAAMVDLEDLSDLDELRALIDRDTDIPRIVLLLSPT